MELNLNGKVVVVTGGSSGIGEETAMEFAREGCEVTIASRSEKKLAEAAGRFEVEGFQVHTQVVDVSKPEDISALGEKVFQQFGRIDVWINNAGGNITKPFLELTELCYQHQHDFRILGYPCGSRLHETDWRRRHSQYLILHGAYSCHTEDCLRSYQGGHCEHDQDDCR